MIKQMDKPLHSSGTLSVLLLALAVTCRDAPPVAAAALALPGLQGGCAAPVAGNFIYSTIEENQHDNQMEQEMETGAVIQEAGGSVRKLCNVRGLAAGVLEAPHKFRRRTTHPYSCTQS